MGFPPKNLSVAFFPGGSSAGNGGIVPKEAFLHVPRWIRGIFLEKHLKLEAMNRSGTEKEPDKRFGKSSFALDKSGCFQK